MRPRPLVVLLGSIMACGFAATAPGAIAAPAPGLASSETPTRATVPAPAELSATRIALLDRVRHGDAPSLAIGVAEGDRILWTEAMGWADREAAIPATTSTRYAVASVTKSITGTGILAMVADGRLRLDQPVQPILGEVRLSRAGGATDSIRIEQLLAHTAGIPHLWQYEYRDRPQTRIDRSRLIADDAFVATPPGGHFLYSNLGFGVLAAVLEKTGHAPYQRVMEREVYAPLAMRATTCEAWVGDPGVVRGYDAAGKPIPYPYRLGPDGGAGLFSTVDDLLRYGRFHVGALQTASPGSTAAIVNGLAGQPASEHYLHGWGVVRLSDATVLISDGEAAGATAAIVLVPERRLVVVVLCNRTGGPASESAVSILSALIPGFEERFAAAAGAIDAELSGAGTLPTGRLRGILIDGADTLATSLDLTDPAAPRLRLEGHEFLVHPDGWDHGAWQASVDGTLPLGVERARSHRLQLTLWPDAGGLRGVAQEDLVEDRPRYGVPHFVKLSPAPR